MPTPATPPARLAKLAEAYPAQVLHNPVLPLLLEEPAWLEKLPGPALLAVPDHSLPNRLALLGTEAGRRAVFQELIETDSAIGALQHLTVPDLLAGQHRAALAASPVPGQRLAVAARPEFREVLRDDPHLLVRRVARGEMAPPALATTS